MTIWQVLQIEKTTNKKEIKKAYAKLLKIYHPEDDPENFKALQEAYQQAIKYANDNKNTKTVTPIYSKSNEQISKININVNQNTTENTSSNRAKTSKLNINVDQDINNIEAVYRNKELFNKTDDEFTIESYVIENIISKLGKTMTYESLFTLFQDPTVSTYLNNQMFKEILDNNLKKKKYKGTFDELTKIIELLSKNNLYESTKRVINIQKVHYTFTASNNKSQKRIVIFIAIFSAITTLLFNNPFNTNNQDDSQNNQLVDSNLNGYQIKDEEVFSTLVDPNGKDIIKDIDTVQYTLTSYVILHNDDGFISFNTKNKKQYTLDFESVFVFDQKNNNKQYLACLQNETWYLCELNGEVKQTIQGNIKGANCIEFIDDVPYFTIES